MNEGMKMLLGMSLAYVTSFAGLILAWYAYRRRTRGRSGRGKEGGDE
jgi:hypothetical protein